MEDFVRWHSPPDWTEAEVTDGAKETSDNGDLLSTRGQLSSRMQKEGVIYFLVFLFFFQLRDKLVASLFYRQCLAFMEGLIS